MTTTYDLQKKENQVQITKIEDGYFQIDTIVGFQKYEFHLKQIVFVEIFNNQKISLFFHGGSISIFYNVYDQINNSPNVNNQNLFNIDKALLLG